MNRQRDLRNLKKFREVVKRAYVQGKRKGWFPAEMLNEYDRAIESPYCMQDGRGQVIFPWRVLRRRVARMYWQQRGRLWKWDFQLDWDAIFAWVLDNIVSILKMLLMILPLVI
jgi:hypothetical protein